MLSKNDNFNLPCPYLGFQFIVPTYHTNLATRQSHTPYYNYYLFVSFKIVFFFLGFECLFLNNTVCGETYDNLKR